MHQGGCTPQINPSVQDCAEPRERLLWICPCLSLFLGLQSHSPPLLLLPPTLSSHSPLLLSPSSVTSTRLWDPRGSESHKLQSAMSASSAALSPFLFVFLSLLSISTEPLSPHTHCCQYKLTGHCKSGNYNESVWFAISVTVRMWVLMKLLKAFRCRKIM